MRDSRRGVRDAFSSIVLLPGGLKLMGTAHDQEQTNIWRRIVSGGAWLVGGKALAAFSTIGAQALLARLLSPSEVGTYFLMFSIVTIAATVSHAGLNVAVVRFTAKALAESNRADAARAIRLSVGWGAAGAAMVALSLVPAGRVIADRMFHTPSLATVMEAGAIWMFFFALQNLLAEAYRGLHDIRTATMISGVASGVLTVAGFAMLAFTRGHASLRQVMLTSAGALAIVVLAALAGLLREFEGSRSDPTLSMGILMRASLPMWASSLMLLCIGQLDLWIIGAFLTGDAVALYGAAWRIVSVISMPLLIVNGVLPPLIADLYARGETERLERTLQRTAFIAGAPAAVLLVTVAVFGEQILNVVYGNYYTAGAGVIAILSVGQIFNVLSGSCGLTLMMTGHHDTMMTMSIISAVTMVGLSILLMRIWDVNGVAAGAASGLALQNVLMWAGAKRKTGLKTHASIASLWKR